MVVIHSTVACLIRVAEHFIGHKKGMLGSQQSLSVSFLGRGAVHFHSIFYGHYNLSFNSICCQK